MIDLYNKNTELAAALFFLLGENIPHDPLLESEAEKIKEHAGTTEKALQEILRLCGIPETPQQYYICAQAYSWLGKNYSRQSAHCAEEYLASPGWEDSGFEAGGNNGSVSSGDIMRAAMFSNLAASREGMGDLKGAHAAVLEAYNLDPSNAMHAVRAADLLVKLGKLNEAREFLLQQKHSIYYRPAKLRDEYGRPRVNDMFSNAIDSHLFKLFGRDAARMK